MDTPNYFWPYKRACGKKYVVYKVSNQNVPKLTLSYYAFHTNKVSQKSWCQTSWCDVLGTKASFIANMKFFMFFGKSGIDSTGKFLECPLKGKLFIQSVIQKPLKIFKLQCFSFALMALTHWLVWRLHDEDHWCSLSTLFVCCWSYPLLAVYKYHHDSAKRNNFFNNVIILQGLGSTYIVVQKFSIFALYISDSLINIIGSHCLKLAKWQAEDFTTIYENEIIKSRISQLTENFFHDEYYSLPELFMSRHQHNEMKASPPAKIEQP